MSRSSSRRNFISSTAVGTAALASSGWSAGQSLLAGLTRVNDEQVNPGAGFVKFRPEIEPLVKLIEDTPRQKLMEEMGLRVQNGLSYQQVLSALFLAGIRNVQPRPAVGFKFHAVLVVNSAHIASLASPEQDRWLPIFWALDEFKSSQARDISEGNWTMPAVDESAIPSPERVVTAFQSAMHHWDESAADTASAGVARYVGANEMLEQFAQFAARDFRSIGHKAIYLANSWRTLQTIGWQHSEPVIRSLAYAMLNHNGEPNPADNDLAPDRSWKYNQTIVDQISPGWLRGKVQAGATSDLLESLRSANPDEVARMVVKLLNDGISPQSVFDSLHLGAGELLMRQPGIVAMHAVTTVNALRFLFDNVGNERTRQLLLLQTAAFLPQFREAMVNRGKVGDTRIDMTFRQASEESIKVDESLSGILSLIRKDPANAAHGTMRWLEGGNDAEELMHAARQLIFLKGNDAHDYKFSSATLEDYYKISPEWRNQFLASSTFSLRGSSEKDNGLVDRIRSALA